MKKTMLQVLKGIIGVLGRLLLCATFLAAGLGYSAPEMKRTAQLLATKGAVAPQVVLVGGAVLLVMGSLSIVVGYKARWGALLLLSSWALATCYFHGFGFRTLVSAEARHEQVIHLATNLSLIGAMLFIVANGAGQMSLDKGC